MASPVASAPERTLAVPVDSKPEPAAGPGDSDPSRINGKAHPFQLALRIALALLLAAGLLIFLAALRLAAKNDDQLQTLRPMSTILPASLPAPPPPPPNQPPPPPQPVPLPKLEIQLDSIAPPLKATLDRHVELKLSPTQFAPQIDAPRETMIFSLADLDGKPRLVSRPNAQFPSSLRAKGVRESSATLEVSINPQGKVKVLRVLDSTHPEIVSVARSFASSARFTAPKKDGRAVTTNFRWPLLFKP